MLKVRGLATSRLRSRLPPRIRMVTVTVPRSSGSSTMVIARLDVGAWGGEAVAAALVCALAGSPSAVASFCTMSITCCIGDSVGAGASCVSTETDLTMEAIKAAVSSSRLDVLPEVSPPDAVSPEAADVVASIAAEASGMGLAGSAAGMPAWAAAPVAEAVAADTVVAAETEAVSDGVASAPATDPVAVVPDAVVGGGAAGLSGRSGRKAETWGCVAAVAACAGSEAALALALVSVVLPCPWAWP